MVDYRWVLVDGQRIDRWHLCVCVVDGMDLQVQLPTHGCVCTHVPMDPCRSLRAPTLPADFAHAQMTFDALRSATAAHILEHADDFGPFLPYEDSEDFERNPAGTDRPIFFLVCCCLCLVPPVIQVLLLCALRRSSRLVMSAASVCTSSLLPARDGAASVCTWSLLPPRDGCCFCVHFVAPPTS